MDRNSAGAVIRLRHQSDGRGRRYNLPSEIVDSASAWMALEKAELYSQRADKVHVASSGRVS